MAGRATPPRGLDHLSRAAVARATLAVIVVAGLVAGAPADAPSRSTANARVYSDDVGEVTCCTRDIVRVSVANDDAGMITFAVVTRADSEEQGDDDDLVIGIDADRDRSTGQDDGGWGSLPGADYQIAAGVSASGVDGVQLGRWSKAQAAYVEVPRAGVRGSASGDVFRFQVDRHLLGDVDRFRFGVVLAEVTSFGGVSFEIAPEPGLWEFPVEIALSRLRPVLSASSSTRRRTFVARLGLRVAGTRAFLASGRVVCGARLGGRSLSLLRQGFIARRAVCSWRLPRSAAGKVVRARIGVYVTGRPASFVARTLRTRIG